MKKKTKTFWLFIGLLVVALLAYHFLSGGANDSKTYTQFSTTGTQASSTSFSTVDSILSASDGNQYYEGRCIDVSSFLSQGYYAKGTDNMSCPIACKSTNVGSINLGKLRGISCYTATYNHCGTGCYFSNAGPCGKYAGTTGACGDTSKSDYYGDTLCQISGETCEGGFKQVLNTCSFSANDLLAAETFSGPITLTKASTRYPIKSVCRAHPAIITNSATLTSTTTNSVYDDLVNGKTVTLSASQTITLFYVIENNANLPTRCDSSKNLALDVNNTAVCKSTLGFTYLCSQGTFDAASGTCVVQPQSALQCAQGRYDITQNVCVYNPPIQYDCGSNDYYYSVDRNVCIASPKKQYVCDPGYTLFKPTQAQCSANGGTWLACPQCASDKICASDICQPECSTEIACRIDSPNIVLCTSNGGTITNSGTCTIKDELNQTYTVRVCPVGSAWNSVSQLCEKEATTTTVCGDGTAPIYNALTNTNECPKTVTSFTQCPKSQVYDQSKDRCVDSIQLITPSGGVSYSENRNNCKSDIDCTGSQVCQAQYGVCATKISTNILSGISPIVLILIGVALVIGIMVFIRRGKKR